MLDTDQLDDQARSAAAAFQSRALTADETTLQLLFTEARTHYGWQDRDVTEETLRDFDEPAADARDLHTLG